MSHTHSQIKTNRPNKNTQQTICMFTKNEMANIFKLKVLNPKSKMNASGINTKKFRKGKQSNIYIYLQW